jgi:hypothetical protein
MPVAVNFGARLIDAVLAAVAHGKSGCRLLLAWRAGWRAVGWYGGRLVIRPQAVTLVEAWIGVILRVQPG